MDNTNCKQYWENYTSYWEDKVNEANDKENAQDKTLDDELIGIYTKKLNVTSKDTFLDFGCAFCRLYPFYRKLTNGANNYYGTDIAKAPLEHAVKKYHELAERKALKECDGIHIPFDDQAFDKAVCFGVLDACNQELVLQELLRVLKIEGTLLVTGKNSNYIPDDEAAFIAEVNARKKGHPNYFTDVPNMTGQLLERGIEVEQKFYFIRRGDFAINKFEKEMPEKFYEWAYVLRKKGNEKVMEFKKFSNKYSNTYKEKSEVDKLER